MENVQCFNRSNLVAAAGLTQWLELKFIQHPQLCFSNL